MVSLVYGILEGQITKYLRMQENQYGLGDLSFKLNGLLWKIMPKGEI
jgi:hypothetical protein